MGKATKPGIKVKEPTSDDSMTPSHPESAPMTWAIISWSISAKRKLTIKITTRNSGSMFSNAFKAFLRAFFVLTLSLWKDNKRSVKVRPHRSISKYKTNFL